MRVTVLLLALASAFTFAADNSAVAPQSATNLQSTVVGHRSPVIGGAEVITIPQMLSYQGKLTDTLGQPVEDTLYAVRFRLYAQPTGGTHFWEENQQVRTQGGLFAVLLGAVTPIGSVPATGALYLGMGVAGGAELTPRVRIVSAAYAYKADTANYALAAPGGGDNAWVRGTPDSVLYTVRYLGIARGGSFNMLHGTTRISHVNLGVACTTGLSGQNKSAVTIAGGAYNVASDTGTTIAGGLRNRATGKYAVVAGGFTNVASGAYSSIGGGYADTAAALYGAALSGYSNTAGDAATDTGATVAGGYDNSARAAYSTVGGGRSNYTSAAYSTVGGGSGNGASGILATIGGGLDNFASSIYSTISGGGGNSAIAQYATVAGGLSNVSSGSSSFSTGYGSDALHSNSAAFNGEATSASNQTRVGILSKASGTFTIDHPLDPSGKILNHYFVEGPEMLNIYRGSVVLSAAGRAEANLPDYFDALNGNPQVVLTGIGSSDVYLVEEVSGNRFAIGGKPGTKVNWIATGERKDVSAEVTRRMMPVEQPKSGPLAGRMLDDDFLVGCMDQLVREGKAQGIDFRTAGGRAKYEKMKQHLREAGQR